VHLSRSLIRLWVTVIIVNHSLQSTHVTVNGYVKTAARGDDNIRTQEGSNFSPSFIATQSLQPLSPSSSVHHDVSESLLLQVLQTSFSGRRR